MITSERAWEIWKWSQWNDGMCAAGGNPPGFPRETPQERIILKALWHLPQFGGNSTIWSVLRKIMNGTLQLPKLQEMFLELDLELTGKCDHCMFTRFPTTPAEWFTRSSSSQIVYLSDGGYSRIFLKEEDGPDNLIWRVGVSNVSRPEVITRASTGRGRELLEQIEKLFQEWWDGLQ